MGSIEFADPTGLESELVSNMLSESAHVKLDKKVFRRYPLDRCEEQGDHVIFFRRQPSIACPGLRRLGGRYVQSFENLVETILLIFFGTCNAGTKGPRKT